MILFSDIDGTLLNAQRELSPRTIAVVNLLHKKGIPLILTSSRSPTQMYYLQKQAHIEELPLIAFNGALIMEGEKELLSVEIPFEILQEIVKFNHSLQGEKHISLYYHNQWYAPQTDHWTQREEHNTRTKAHIAPAQEVLSMWKTQNHGAHKLMIMGQASYVDALMAFLEHFSELSCYRSKDTYLEVTHQSVNKLTGICHLLTKKYNTTTEKAIAFGDNYNDIPMLSGVGVGVAVGNARPEVKQVAKYTLHLNHKDDAVAIFLETHFKEILN